MVPNFFLGVYIESNASNFWKCQALYCICKEIHCSQVGKAQALGQTRQDLNTFSITTKIAVLKCFGPRTHLYY